jgi:hypothetical protein
MTSTDTQPTSPAAAGASTVTRIYAVRGVVSGLGGIDRLAGSRAVIRPGSGRGADALVRLPPRPVHSAGSVFGNRRRRLWPSGRGMSTIGLRTGAVTGRGSTRGGGWPTRERSLERRDVRISARPDQVAHRSDE